MSYISKPIAHHPALPKNDLGLTRREYEGSMSTLCAGCGHDSITAAIIEACYGLSIPAHRIAKLSGIGCSSKTPDYFLGNSHGFNSVHGRMPSVLTGANLANRDLVESHLQAVWLACTEEPGNCACKPRADSMPPNHVVVGSTFLALSPRAPSVSLRNPHLRKAIRHPLPARLSQAACLK